MLICQIKCTVQGLNEGHHIINRQSNKWHYLRCSNCGASNALTAFPTVRNQALILFSGSLIDSCIYICIYVYTLIIESTLSTRFLESEAPGNSPLQMQDFKNDRRKFRSETSDNMDS